MVEHKTSIYDEEPEPPLVPATLAPNEASALPQEAYIVDTEGIPPAPHSAPPSPRNNEGPTTTTTTTNSQDDDELEPPLVPATLAPKEASALPQEPIDTDDSAPPSPRNNNEGPTATTSTPATDSPQQDKEMVASGTAGAVLGFFMGGPLLAALFGFGAAYATQKPGIPGDAARALGDVALSTKEKAKELDDHHHIVDRSKKAATEAWDQAKTYDRQYNVLDTVKDAIIYLWGAFANFVQEHRLLERGVDGVGRGYEYVAERLSGASSTSSSNSDANKPPEKKDKEYDGRHNVLNTAKDAIIFIVKGFVKFVQEHRLLERGVDGVGRGYKYVAERASGESRNDDANRPQETAQANAT